MVEVAVYVGPKRHPHRINRGEVPWDTGDLVVARNPLGRIGRKERHTYLWLLVDGLPQAELAALMAWEWQLGEADPDNPRAIPPVLLKRKAPHFVPLERLESVARIDVRRALDSQDPYQPFITWESDDLGRTAPAGGPIHVRDVVYDKATGERVLNQIRRSGVRP